MTMGMMGLITRLQKINNPEQFEEKTETEQESAGFDIPVPEEFSPQNVSMPEENKLTDVEVTYPLVPNDPDEGEKVYAWAYITWDDKNKELVYKVIEPEKTERLEKVLERVKDILERSFNIDFQDVNKGEAHEYLENKIDQLIEKYDISLNDREREIIRYYTKRDYVGLGKLQPLMNDKEIEDISGDGVDIPVYVDHRNPKFGSVKTDVEWHDGEELDQFVMKLAQRSGKSISVANPMLDGSLPDGSRVQATLATDIARKGSNFTIRRFTEDPLTPVDMMNFETENARLLSYLWLLIEFDKSCLIAGTTGAGKTSQLNALSLFIEPEKKIVSIEDTPELRLPHDHWVPEVARSGFGSSASEGGEVSMDNLLKESLRQRPEFIIVGEVRGEEAYILFQQMATGHTGMSTIHSDSLEKLMNRLTTQPIDLSPSLIETLDVIILISRIRRKGSYIRRIKGIYEVRDYNEGTGLDANKVFGYDPDSDEYYQENKSLILEDISEETTMSSRDLQQEIKNRQHVLNHMQNEDITYFKDVGQWISDYYNNPDEVLEKIEQSV